MEKEERPVKMIKGMTQAEYHKQYSLKHPNRKKLKAKSESERR